jgi:histidinol-phosphate aminotransferase
MSVDGTISRRTLLRHLGAATAMTAVPAPIEGWERTSEGAGTPAIESRLPRELIRLDRNENAYGASPLAIVATEASLPVGRYPQAEAEELQGHIAQVHGIAPEQVVLGCGSTEILRMAAEVFLRSGKNLVVAQPTFDWLSSCARRVGAPVIAVPLKANHSHDLDAMLAKSDATTALYYLCNPNNPTGTLTPRLEVSAFVRRLPPGSHVLIDEAYHQYVGESPAYASFIDRPLDDPRVIVVRTFSKIYGLAGLRVGYAVCAPEAARLLRSAQLPDHVNVAGAKAALAALGDTDHLRTCVARNTDDRQEFFNQANARMLRVIDSQTNFVMLDTGVPANQVVQHFNAHHVLVAGQIPGFGTHVRVSLGTREDMERFWNIWDLLPVHQHMDRG